MKIVTENGTEIENPSDADIRRVIESLNDSGNGFAILSTAEEHYMQTAGCMKDGFILEYREGSWDQHFQASTGSVQTSDVIRAMQQYAAGNESWRTSLTWEPHEASSGSGCAKAACIALVAPLGGIAYVLY